MHGYVYFLLLTICFMINLHALDHNKHVTHAWAIPSYLAWLKEQIKYNITTGQKLRYNTLNAIS